MGLDTGMGVHRPATGSLGGVSAEVGGGERRWGKAVRWLRARALESGCLVSNPDSVPPRCVTLGKSLSFSVSQYPIYKVREISVYEHRLCSCRGQVLATKLPGVVLLNPDSLEVRGLDSGVRQIWVRI